MPDWHRELRHRLAEAHADVAQDADLVDELAQHLEDQYAELRARGRSRGDARAMLLAELTGASLRDTVKQWRRTHPTPPIIPLGAPPRGRWLEATWQDIRYGWRSLRRAPVFTVVAVLSLAVGIGATTAIFGLLHAVLLERLALPHPEELIQLQRSTPRGAFDRFGYDAYRALAQAPGMPRLEGLSSGGVSVLIGRDRDVMSLDLVTGGFFDMLGVRPIMGRIVTATDEAEHAAVLVVSQEFWEARLAADPTVIGRAITVNDNAFTIIGVLPRSYRGLYFGSGFRMAAPLTVARLVGLPDFTAATPNGQALLTIFGRRPRGQTLDAVAQTVDQVFQQCCAAVAPPPPTSGARVATPAGRGRERASAVDVSRGAAGSKFDLRDEYRAVLVALMAGVVVLLLIACANVGILLLARATARQRELGVRIAIGATRARIVRQLLTESLEIAVLGGLLGLTLARLGTGVLAHNLPPIATTLADRVVLRPDGTILGVATLVTLGCTLIFGVLPALRATRTDLVTSLHQRVRGAGQSVIDRGIVVAQMALALVLVTSAALFGATLRHLRDFGGASDAAHVLFARIDTRGTIYEHRDMATIYPDILERIRRLPGIASVAGSSRGLARFGGLVSRRFVRVPGFVRNDDADFTSLMVAVTPDFFGTTGIGLERGRAFDARDGAGGALVAIVSRAFAGHFFPGRDPIGGTIFLGEEPDAPQLLIVGVARDAHFDDLRSPPTEVYYTPLAQSGSALEILSIRSIGDPLEIAPLVRHEIEAAAPGIRVRDLAGFARVIDDALARERLAAGLASLFGFCALGLAAVGLYGVVAYAVNRRRAEIGVRRALGAQRADVVWLVLRQTMNMTALGVLIGVPLAFGAAKGIATQLYGIKASDPRALIVAALSLLVVGAAAAAAPGRRASRVEPVEALRGD